MSRRTVRLTLDNLPTLPPSCASCLFWELDAVARGRVCAGEEYGEKEAWVSEVLREWGSCGRVAMVDDEAVGYAVWAPSAFVPGGASFPTSPVSEDAVQLTAVHVDPAHRGGGLGRMLVQGMAKDLLKRGGIRAVEAFGETRPWRAGHCVVPADFLSAVGFKTQQAHAFNPRMRMDLKSTVTWRYEVEQALERLVGAVRPSPSPKPARPPARTAHR